MQTDIEVKKDELLVVNVIGDGVVTILLPPLLMDEIEEEMAEVIGKTAMYDALAILSDYRINIAGSDVFE